jgi:hypothetical protein
MKRRIESAPNHASPRGARNWYRNVRNSVAALLLSMSFAHNAFAANSWPASSIGGVYAIGAIQHGKFRFPNGQIDPGVASNPNVAGLLLRYNWQDLEGADQVFDWSTVDNDVGIAASAGKQVAISVVAGAETPSWVYGAGAQAFTFMWDRAFGPTACTLAQTPVPWDPVFQAKWAEFVAAFGERYDSNPVVARVVLTGFNSKTPELYLPSSVNAPINVNGQKCTSLNDVANWKAAGYTRTKAEAAWNAIAAEFHAAFPDKPFAASMSPNGFPPIDRNGKVMPKASEDDQANTDVISKSIALYGQQFILQNDGLSATWLWKLEQGYSNQINTGYQMVNFVMGANLPGAVTLALTATPEFLEMSTTDIDNATLASTVASANSQLP